MIHGYWLDRHGIGGSYSTIDVLPEDFRGLLERVRAGDYLGGNITIPHKETAFATVDRKDEAAMAIGAVNTVWREGSALCGANTDAYGFAANLDDRAPGWDSGKGPAVVLGAGGSARAVLFALRARGFDEIRIVNRTVDRARALARHFGGRCSAHDLNSADALLVDATLLVNTTPAGMQGTQASQGVPVDVARLPDAALVADIVYVPLETPLLAAARKRGLSTVDGLGMLLHQAVPGFERWFGIRPEVTPELRALIEADITAPRAG